MRVAVITSGGDGPGMNAAIRAIVRIGCYHEHEMIGIEGGLQGLIDKQFRPMDARSVANIIHRGGTILGTGRSKEFRSDEGQQKAAKNLEAENIEALVIIGGNGSMTGMSRLQRFWNGKIIGLPGTIDNDMYGTDYSIGFDTAVNNALEAIDKIRDTAQAFDRFFLIEVMGRDSGAIAIHVGIACGAEAIAVPETPTDLKAIAETIKRGREAGKKSAFVIVAEGDEIGNANDIAKELAILVDERCRVSVLGYIQRGGNPTSFDRILSTRLGAYAIECLNNDIAGVLVGVVNGELTTTPLADTWSKKKNPESALLKLVDKLSI
jgi:6-phosphofructokinase 1